MNKDKVLLDSPMRRVNIDVLALDRGRKRGEDERRYVVVATGDGLIDNDGKFTDKGRKIAREAISAVAVDGGAVLMDDIMQEQFKNCPSGFCPDIKEAYERGHGCVIGISEVNYDDGIIGINEGDWLLGRDEKIGFLDRAGLLDKT